MTRDEARGQAALVNLDKYIVPAPIFIGSQHARLYELEAQRADLIHKIAHEWEKVCGQDRKEHWVRSIPQVLHDTLEAYQTECGIVAAEAFLQRHGWTVIRPDRKE